MISRVLQETAQQGHEGKLFLLGGSLHEEWLSGLNHRTVGRVNESRWSRYMKYAAVFPAVLMDFKPDAVLCADGAGLRLARLLRRPLLPATRIAAWFHVPLKKAHEPSLRLADFHLCINSENLRYLKCQTNWGNKNVYLIHNPVEVDGDVKLIPAPENFVHFVYVGRLIIDSPKNVRDFICALGGTHGNWSASIVGDGPDREELMSLARDLSIDGRITWAGWKERPWDYVKSASVLVLTSEHEGFPMVLVEAMARGVPCISSDCDGCLDIVQNDVNGWLYPVGRTEALAAILNEIVRGDRQLPDRDAVRETVLRFASRRVVEAMVHACSIEIASRGSQTDSMASKN